MKTVKCLCYHRVSTADQNATLAREELRAAAKARGMEVVAEIEETGSGARNDRPGLAEVMKQARAGKISAVLVWKLDRFGRSALDLLGNIEELRRLGVRFISTSQGIDLGGADDAMGNLIVSVLAGVAQFERAVIIERTNLGLARARRNGRILGRPRKGNVAEPAVVADLRAQGKSWSVIAATLGCTASAARRACQIGVAKAAPEVPETTAAA